MGAGNFMLNRAKTLPTKLTQQQNSSNLHLKNWFYILWINFAFFAEIFTSLWKSVTNSILCPASNRENKIEDCQMVWTALCIYLQWPPGISFCNLIQCKNFTTFSWKFYGAKLSGEIVSIPRSLLPSVPSSQLGKVPLTVENWNGSWLQNNGADFSCQNHLFEEKYLRRW